jgi:hypothetical protein
VGDLTDNLDGGCFASEEDAGPLSLSAASLEERVAFFYQDRMARRVAARFMFSSTLIDELNSKMDRLFLNFDPDEASDTAAWFKDTFRFESPKTPQGQKDLKNKAQSFWWHLQDAGNKKDYQGNAYNNPKAVEVAERAWKQDVKPLAGDLVRYFSNEGGKIVPKEIQAGGNTYLNLIGFDQKKIGQYVTAMEAVFDEVKGWRRKALGGLKVALAGPKEFRGTAAGVYKSGQDTLYVRATPNVLKRSAGTYGSFDYILIHELGHRYERKNHVPFDFERGEWHTSKYSTKDGESFAELFALSNFKMKGPWDQDRVERFEALMTGAKIEEKPGLPPHLQKYVGL